jgi:hypothetical protein
VCGDGIAEERYQPHQPALGCLHFKAPLPFAGGTGLLVLAKPVVSDE